MNQYKVGDKFLIEIAEAIKGYGNDPKVPDPFNLPVLYRIKGFNALVFDEYGLDKLQKYEEEKYAPSELYKFRQKAFEEGMVEAWNLAKMILHGRYDQTAEIFNMDIYDMTPQTKVSIIETHSPLEIKEKIAVWEKEKAKEIKVGDVVEHELDDCTGVVLDWCSEDEFHVFTENGCVERWIVSDVNNTNIAVDIKNFMPMGGAK